MSEEYKINCHYCGAELKIKKPTQCNICAKELDEFDEQENLIIHTTVGYGSTHDGEEIRLQFCCECFDKIVDECKVSPEIPNLSTGW